jgi:hypothetical protein
MMMMTMVMVVMSAANGNDDLGICGHCQRCHKEQKHEGENDLLHPSFDADKSQKRSSAMQTVFIASKPVQPMPNKTHKNNILHPPLTSRCLL